MQTIGGFVFLLGVGLRVEAVRGPLRRVLEQVKTRLMQVGRRIQKQLWRHEAVKGNR